MEDRILRIVHAELSRRSLLKGVVGAAALAAMPIGNLAFSQAQGNDLSTPMPEHGFPGLKPGDRWCLCAARWCEALEAGSAPRVILAATHEDTLEVVELKDLKRYAIDLA